MMQIAFLILAHLAFPNSISQKSMIVNIAKASDLRYPVSDANGLFVKRRSKYPIQHGECRDECGDCDGDANFEKVEISKFKVVLFEDGAPHNARKRSNG